MEDQRPDLGDSEPRRHSDRDKDHHRSHHRHHHSSKHDKNPRDEDDRRHRHHHRRRKRSRDRDDEDEDRKSRKHHRHSNSRKSPKRSDLEREKSDPGRLSGDELATAKSDLKRDTWMEAPSALEIDYVQRSVKKAKQPIFLGSNSRSVSRPQSVTDQVSGAPHSDSGVEDQEQGDPLDGNGQIQRDGVKPDHEDRQKTPVKVDQNTLNRLKAGMMKAKLKGGANAARLEEEYIAAVASFNGSRGPETVVLSAMDNRMLTGGRKGEVIRIENKRGLERKMVKENEDMSIEDMVREERRTKGQAGGEGRRFAERIAKDGKFDDDLEYMDENAEKLARRVQKSEINMRGMAISDFKKSNKILDSCPLCHHENTDTPPVAPLLSLATRVYLTLPTEPEVADGGACIIPIQHRANLLECDEDEWEEIRNFMKSLTRMYHDQGRDVLFYENAAHPQKRKHAAMEVIPLPYSLGEVAPAFFKEAILTSDEEWSQHSKIINTQARARDGLGKVAFRKSLAKEMPYFHVWFNLDGGLGHVVEDTNRWPKGDLFAREIIGGMLDIEPDIIKRQGRWQRNDPRLDGFRKRWKKFDWTGVLTDGS
ncbi:MAG: hypothetical protein M1814_003022 [Vezdaea aestivalis]|nr:MAG: hypothetical protein M1814_003022 [Vezdaea aestivalis]